MIIYVCDCCGKEVKRQDEDFGRACPGACNDALKAFKDHRDQSLAAHLTEIEADKANFVAKRIGKKPVDAPAH